MLVRKLHERNVRVIEILASAHRVVLLATKVNRVDWVAARSDGAQARVVRRLELLLEPTERRRGALTKPRDTRLAALRVGNSVRVCRRAVAVLPITRILALVVISPPPET